MKQLTNALSRGNLTAREKFLMLIKNEMHRAKTGKDILTPADKDALENWHAKDNAEAREWNTLNEGWKHSGRMDLEIELLYKDAQVAHLAQLPFIMELVGYPVTQRMEGAITTLKQIKKVTVAEAAEIAKFTPDEKNKYEESLKYYRDLKNVVDTSFDEGKAEGKVEGKEERNIEIARQMKSEGEPIEKIVRFTGLTKQKIENL